ncbi:MAG: DUF2848 family protein [Desulfuromonadales bacterium]|nr:DUF2848 family protein [Desulfuromonadales bacterium]MBN2793545.1 DUF2848 family protein [Desulfuromonadales bacterium]
MSAKTLSLMCDSKPLSVVIDRLIVAGWVGKDTVALQKHIDELAELGVEPPGRTPTYMSLSPDILTTAEEVSAIAATSSGEVEAVLVRDRDGVLYLGVGSDHTDRDFERYSIPASKQMCPKPLAREIWLFEDVEDHLGQLVLRSWMTDDQGHEVLYQEGDLNANRELKELLQGMPNDCVSPGQSFCLYCGTFPAIGGLRYGRKFIFEIYDPILKRSLKHHYEVETLPQFL